MTKNCSQDPRKLIEKLRRSTTGIDVEYQLATGETSRRIYLDSTASTLQLLNGSSGESGRAGILQRLNHYLGQPGALAQEGAKIRAVTTADVQRAVQQILRKEARVVVVTRPRGEANDKP